MHLKKRRRRRRLLLLLALLLMGAAAWLKWQYLPTVRRLVTLEVDDETSDLVTESVDAVLSRENLTYEAKEWLSHSVACRAAIKAGHRASSEELVRLAEKILCGDIPKYCPHGRPVYVMYSREQLEKDFGRIV